MGHTIETPQKRDDTFVEFFIDQAVPRQGNSHDLCR